MKHYMVVTPEIEEIVPPGYMEYYRCSVPIETDSWYSAIRLALKTDEFKDWRTYCRDNLMHPLAGVTAEEVLCEHGLCMCCTECDKCLEEWNNEVLDMDNSDNDISVLNVDVEVDKDTGQERHGEV